MNEREGLEERRERTILDNPPSEETALKMAEFFMKTSVPRILAARKAEQEKINKEGDKEYGK
ncbi:MULTISPECIES: hypothetical protein [Bacillus cereus group]|uniref:Uncharacterized protein n=1 Tax=Bacillus thuringiensis serovar mexicanensis TaxID=180868 RepID=A0A242W6P9_BACTU|nr:MULTISPECIES: hypothetical protein [Bacillus cereus group]EEM57714.1 hypothetical protein bthur0007_45150 [Bacillus thuringiensis serovar monterrey BGSC 4AJ1]MEB9668968.1 hypothetical protein [Bacillus anthracis]OTW47937.1 hypothetical protein BK699_12170 [Bacillus thuringiensis serovar mexicanensis]OTW97970.1 hypothetical protein BK705_29570 [Bacillus thuringiensis serovar monterrey]